MDPTESSDSDARGAEGLSTSPGTLSFLASANAENTEKARFVIPGTGDTPPKVVSMEEIMGVVKNIEDMVLAHEIAVNPEFKLTAYEPPDNSLEKKIKEIMTKAYWDVLRDQLKSDPPNFEHAISLLGEIKMWLKDVISKKNRKALDQIYDVLDEKVIKQQAENGVLDFRAYANFVLEIMAESCAPIRDKQIEDLTKVDDVVETFRGIVETLSVMKLDMANTLLSIARNDVLANSIEYEKKKFKEYLNFYKDGFPATEDWLKRNKIQNDSVSTSPTHNNTASSQDTRTATESAIVNAYLELMDYKEETEFPELLKMDKERFLELKLRAEKVCVCASAIAIASGIQILGHNAEFKKSLAKQLQIILQSVQNQKEMDDTIMNVWLHLKSVIVSKLAELKIPTHDESTENAMKAQVLQIANRDAPVRALLWKRLLVFLKLSLRSKSIPPPPPSFVDFVDELESIAIAFKRLTTYNYAVYGEVYQNMLASDD